MYVSRLSVEPFQIGIISHFIAMQANAQGARPAGFEYFEPVCNAVIGHYIHIYDNAWLDSTDLLQRRLKNPIEIFVIRNSTTEDFTDILDIFDVDD